MKTYRLFYSWQSDLPKTRNLISDVLKKARKELAKEGIDLVIDQDTRGENGAPHIDNVVMEKIHNSDIFVADLTPVTSMESEIDTKLIPNPNVMFETGIFLGIKGESKIIFLARLEPDQIVKDLPFDINHRSIKSFSEKEDLSNLVKWLKSIFEDIDREREKIVPDYGCHVSFDGDKNHTEIRPKYRRIYYGPETKVSPTPSRSQTSNPAFDVLFGRDSLSAAIAANTKWVNELANTAKIAQVSIIKGETDFSKVPVELEFHNDGNQALDNCIIHIRPVTKGVKFHDTNVERTNPMFAALSPTSLFIGETEASKKIHTINPRCYMSIGKIYLEVPADATAIELEWTVTARQLSAGASGTLSISVTPDYIEEYAKNDRLIGQTSILPYKEDLTD